MAKLLYTCPNQCRLQGQASSLEPRGFYKRKHDSRKIQRFCCKVCGLWCSKAFFTDTYRQHKPHLNRPIKQLLCSAVTQRRIAVLLATNRKTVARKLKLLAELARRSHRRLLSTKLGKIKAVQFDDVETAEHTKLKPLSIPLAVEEKSQIILSYGVAQMPAKGHLAKLSREKYGSRADFRPQAWQKMACRLNSLVEEGAKLTSDSNPHYPGVVERIGKGVVHIQKKGRRACVTGQGELKKGGYDPLFWLNHTAAMLRANISRLVRRTWTTTKKPEALDDHLAVYVDFHNRVLLALRKKSSAA